MAGDQPSIGWTAVIGSICGLAGIIIARFTDFLTGTNKMLLNRVQELEGQWKKCEERDRVKDIELGGLRESVKILSRHTSPFIDQKVQGTLQVTDTKVAEVKQAVETKLAEKAAEKNGNGQ